MSDNGNPQWVYRFEEGSLEMKPLLGGKGAGLAEMSSAGLPVPPGFTITTEACQVYYDAEKIFPEGMWTQSKNALKTVEEQTGKLFGDPQNPLLVSVRSGAAISMPGMMDTVLNLGLNDHTVDGLAQLTQNPHFAWDAYRRFIQMFGEIVLHVPGIRFDRALEALKSKAGIRDDKDLSVEMLQGLIQRYKDTIFGEVRQAVPDDPEEQLRLAIAAVFDSWMNKRSIDYRRLNNIPDDIGTAVNVQAMVFGNTGEESGTGVAFTRNPSTGEPILFGEYLSNAQGEDVVAGKRTPLPIVRLQDVMPAVYDQLSEVAKRLENHYRDMQDIEFTVEQGKLWMLQTRTGKRSGKAAIRIAVDLVRSEVITKEEAVLKISPGHVEQLLHPVIDESASYTVLGAGLPASPGAAFGRVVFNADEAERLAEDGHKVVLVRHETNPDDFHGLVAAQAIVTARGGVTSHAAVVARGMGKCCVVGVEDMNIDYQKQLFSSGGVQVSKGDWVTVDGNNGLVLDGQVPTIEPELDDDFKELMAWADDARRLRVRANADTPHDAQTARNFGAQGIGLCRTEHMFFADERITIMREMIMAPNELARAEALKKLQPMQIEDFEGLFEAMDGFPVTIRLLDPPLHEFLPRYDDLALEIVEMKLQLRLASKLSKIDELLGQLKQREEVLEQVTRLHESNPMLGHRGCRLGIVYPEITRMQAQAIFKAALHCHERGINVQPEIMIPLVSFEKEYELQAEIVRETAQNVFDEYGLRIDYVIGTMIELPRAALIADHIAQHAEFFSFGTNDLTQTTLGLSRDDSARFLPGYVRRGILAGDPFQTLDKTGVGQLIEIGTQRGRSTRENLKVGVCGEHGGDPASVDFFHHHGLDYVSCSAFRVPVARLAAAHAALRDGAEV